MDLIEIINENYRAIIALSSSIPIIKIIYSRFRQYKKNIKTSKDLKPYFEYLDVKKACNLFIETRFQNTSPTYQDEPGFDGLVAEKKLIPTLIKETFREDRERKKFNIILADSGMGKTTFMINLYMKYSIGISKKKYKMKLFRFGYGDILEKLKSISLEESRNTILLLDAFDEDINLTNPGNQQTDKEIFNNRLNKILTIVKDFFVIIITCRTQYFSGEDENPFNINIQNVNGSHILNKVYISPFNENEITKFLNKKYGILKFWNKKRKTLAKEIVLKSYKLMFRPMLLEYVNYLVNEKRAYNYAYEVYESMINGWIKRESRGKSDKEKFKKNLLAYSQAISFEIYRNYKKTGKLSISKNVALSIAKERNINLENYEITGQSLLTKDSEQNWKFAHKSIFEFFIAQKTIRCIKSVEKIPDIISQLDMTKLFIKEKIESIDFIKNNFVYIEGNMYSADVNKKNQIKFKSYFLLKNPVTISQCYLKNNSINNNQSVMLNYFSALEYCIWISKKYNLYFRLPYEHEWENALTKKKDIFKHQGEMWFYGCDYEGYDYYYTFEDKHKDYNYKHTLEDKYKDYAKQGYSVPANSIPFDNNLPVRKCRKSEKKLIFRLCLPFI